MDPSGSVYVDTGDGARQTRKSNSAGTIKVSTGATVVALTGDLPGSEGLRGAGRLASGRKDELLVITGPKIVAVSTPHTAFTTIFSSEFSRSPIAGDPAAGPRSVGTASSGDGGPAIQSRFIRPLSIATDEVGNLFVADQTQQGSPGFAIRFINRSDQPATFYSGTPHETTVLPGDIGTVAGVSGSANSGDGGPAKSATLAGVPPSLSATGTTLYAGVYLPRRKGRAESRVRAINLGKDVSNINGVTVGPGGIETIAGGVRSGFHGDGGDARRAGLSRLPGISADKSGNLYLADYDNHRIRKIDSGGRITTLAGTGEPGAKGRGFNGNYRPANTARLSSPFDVKADSSGRVIISDKGNGQVRAIDRSGMIFPFPGNSAAWRCGKRGRTINGRERPTEAPVFGVDAGPKGEIYFTSGTPARLIVTKGNGAVGTLTGPTSKPNHLSVIGASPSGGVYLLDENARRLAYYNASPEAAVVNGTRVPGRSIGPIRLDGWPQRGKLSEPGLGAHGALAIGAKRELFIADPRYGAVFRVDVSGKATAFAGTGAAPPRDRCCQLPTGLAVDKGGNLYISDAGTQRVWVVNLDRKPLVVFGRNVSPGAIMPIAGDAVSGEDATQALTASLVSPGPLALDQKGNLYIVEGSDHTIRKVARDGRLSTVAGTGQPGFNGDGLRSGLTSLNGPTDISTDRCGNLLVADYINNRIRRVNLQRLCS